MTASEKQWFKFLKNGLPLIISTLSFILGWCNTCNTSALKEQLLSYQYQPRLSLSRPPHIKEIRSQSEPFSTKILTGIPNDTNSNKPPIIIKAHLRITSQLVFKNSGNALAKLYGHRSE